MAKALRRAPYRSGALWDTAVSAVVMLICHAVRPRRQSRDVAERRGTRPVEDLEAGFNRPDGIVPRYWTCGGRTLIMWFVSASRPMASRPWK